MASLLPHNLPSSSSSTYSHFSSVNRFQSTASRVQPVVVVMAMGGAFDEVGRTEEIMRGAMMESNPKRPWWSPIFGIGPRDSANGKISVLEEKEEQERSKTAYRSRLTAEKARVLRKELRETESWHDAMYHSAIASRLACPDRP